MSRSRGARRGWPGVGKHRRLGRMAAVPLALLVLLPGPVHPHSARIGLAARKIVLKLDGATTGKPKFVFVGGASSLVPTPAEDPALVGAAVLVYAPGAAAGRSALIDLDPARWTARTTRGVLQYRYRDRHGTRGGIRKVTVAHGRLVIKGRGGLPWSGDTAMDTLGVLFRVGEEWYCAEATAAAPAGAGGFVARDIAAPEGCPATMCGNGVRELGEACDDGNLDELDSCSLGCTDNVVDCEQRTLTGTWEAIQAVLDQRGCTQAVCHGSSPGQGGLDLRRAVAYANLFQVPSAGSSLLRIVPGGPRRSSFYLKLVKGRDPEADGLPGSPMPNGGPPLDDDATEAIRLWINSGAPETGTVEGTERLLAGCLPEPEPITIEPLPLPAAAAGVQFEMPPFPLAASSETEVCFASYYDFSAHVPARYKDPSGQYFYYNAEELRQDPQSHHLQLIYSNVPASRIHDPAFGAWTCKGGARDGETCEPLDPGACAAGGLCGSQVVPGVACIGFGPRDYPVGVLSGIIGGSQTAQFYSPGRPGFFARVPLKGIVYWNSHAFNLTAKNHLMHARLNKYFTDDRRYEQIGFGDLGTIFMATGTAPFTEREVCAGYTLPQNARLLYLTSHTHKRGKHFWVDAPDGRRLYDSFSYDDPVTANFDPPMLFASPDPTKRRLRFCALYNNGVQRDGTPDPDTVRRRSTTPPNAPLCTPVACAAGRVGAPCAGAGDDRTCDSAPGTPDGWCDACVITAGVSTEDEMFLLFGGYVFQDVTP